MINIDTKLSGDITTGLDKFEAKISGSVILSGVAAMANVLYEELKINTSGAGVVKREKDFVGPMQLGPPGKVTGNLHNAVYRAYSPERSTDATKVYHVSVNKTKAPHWHWVEFGNSRMAAHPYLRPTLSRMNDAVKAGSERMKERLGGGT